MKKHLKYVLIVMAFSSPMLICSCGEDEPPAENAEEIITDITLTFTPSTGPEIVASANDPDGDGPQDLSVNGPINLLSNTSYLLTIDLHNAIDNTSITEEIEEEAEEHMFFFGWQGGIFTAPNGDGNIEDRTDNVIYADEDSNGLPLGLQTSWITGEPVSSTFRVILKHQPGGIKSETSESTDGETDLDLTWDLNIQ